MRRWVERIAILLVGIVIGAAIGGAGSGEEPEAAAPATTTTTEMATTTTEPTTTTEATTMSEESLEGLADAICDAFEREVSLGAMVGAVQANTEATEIVALALIGAAVNAYCPIHADFFVAEMMGEYGTDTVEQVLAEMDTVEPSDVEINDVEVSEPEDLTTDDFEIELVILESQCFNTAGASVTVEPDLATSADVTRDYTIVYEIHGGEATETFNIELHEDGTYEFDQEFISTESCDYVLTAEVVRVIMR